MKLTEEQLTDVIKEYRKLVRKQRKILSMTNEQIRSLVDMIKLAEWRAGQRVFTGFADDDRGLIYGRNAQD